MPEQLTGEDVCKLVAYNIEALKDLTDSLKKKLEKFEE